MTLALLTTGIISLGLAPIYLLYRRRKNTQPLIISIAFFNIGIMLWQLSIIFIYLWEDTTFLHVLAFASAPLALIGSLGISLTFPERKLTRNKEKILQILFLFGLGLCILTLTSDLVVEGYNFSTRKVLLGPFEPLFLSYLSVIFLLTVFSFIRRYIREKETRYYLRIVFLSFGLYGIITFFINFILPIVVGVADFVLIGALLASAPQFSIIYTLNTSRFYKTEFIVGRTVYLIIFAILFYISFYTVISIESNVWGSPMAPQSYLAGVFISLIFSYLVAKLNSVIYGYLDRNIIYKDFSPDSLITNLSRELEQETDHHVIISRIKTTIQNVMKPEKIDIFVFDSSKELNQEQIILRIFIQNTRKRSLMLRELEEERGLIKKASSHISDDLYKTLFNSQTQVLLTLGRGSKAVGVILVGAKINDEPYTIQDVNVLEKIAQLGAISLNRSSLYSEVQQFANTLQLKVDQATADLKEANFQLSKALNNVQEARRRERDMIDVMGHELRTPMGIARNAMAIIDRYDLQEKPPSYPERRRFMAMAIEAAKREIDLIETLLSATKLDASRMQLHLDKVDWIDVVIDGIEGQRYKAAQKNIILDFLEPERQHFVYADRNRVQEIMDNFLSNAVKYSEKGTISIRLWEDEMFGWISVTDKGIGIDEEDLQHLGKKFFRAKQYISSAKATDEDHFNRPGGTGLGLYVTFNLIRIMDGKLYINSKVGVGSSFTFGLPRFRNQQPRHVDQTFAEEQSSTHSRSHIYINQSAPQPPSLERT